MHTHETIVYYVSANGETRSRQIEAGSHAECVRACRIYNAKHGAGAAQVEKMEECRPIYGQYECPYFT